MQNKKHPDNNRPQNDITSKNAVCNEPVGENLHTVDITENAESLSSEKDNIAQVKIVGNTDIIETQTVNGGDTLETQTVSGGDTLETQTASGGDTLETQTASGGDLLETQIVSGGDTIPDPKQKKKSWKKTVFYLAFFVLCIASIGVTAYIDFNTDNVVPLSVAMSVLSKNWYYMVFAVVSCLAVLLFDGMKNSILLRSSTKKPHRKLGLQSAAIIKFYDYVTPFGAGGQPFGIYHISKKGVDGGAGAAAVLTSFFLQQVCFVVLSIISLALSATLPINTTHRVMAIVGAFICLIVPVAVIIFSLMPKITSRVVTGIIRFLAKIKLIKRPDAVIEKALGAVERNCTCIRRFSKNKGVFILSLLCSVCGWAAQCSIAYFSLKAFGYDLPENGFVEWIRMIQMCLILYISVSFIPTPGNAGASELSFYFIFTTSLKGGIGFMAMICWRLLSYYAYILIGALVVFIDKIHEKRLAKQKLTE